MTLDLDSEGDPLLGKDVASLTDTTESGLLRTPVSTGEPVTPTQSIT